MHIPESGILLLARSVPEQQDTVPSPPDLGIDSGLGADDTALDVKGDSNPFAPSIGDLRGGPAAPGNVPDVHEAGGGSLASKIGKFLRSFTVGLSAVVGGTAAGAACTAVTVRRGQSPEQCIAVATAAALPPAPPPMPFCQTRASSC